MVFRCVFFWAFFVQWFDCIRLCFCLFPLLPWTLMPWKKQRPECLGWWELRGDMGVPFCFQGTREVRTDLRPLKHMFSTTHMELLLSPAVLILSSFFFKILIGFQSLGKNRICSPELSFWWLNAFVSFRSFWFALCIFLQSTAFPSHFDSLGKWLFCSFDVIIRHAEWGRQVVVALRTALEWPEASDGDLECFLKIAGVRNLEDPWRFSKFDQGSTHDYRPDCWRSATSKRSLTVPKSNEFRTHFSYDKCVCNSGQWG